MISYLALIEEEEGRFGVMFPDLPGCIAEANTADEATVRAKEALGLFVESSRQDGLLLPKNRTIDQLQADAAEVSAAIERGAILERIAVTGS